MTKPTFRQIFAKETTPYDESGSVVSPDGLNDYYGRSPNPTGTDSALYVSSDNRFHVKQQSRDYAFPLNQFGLDVAKSTPVSGDLYMPIDGYQIYAATGSTQLAYGPIYRVNTPPTGSFAWVNQGTATMITANGGIFLNVPKAAGSNWRILKKSAPATPYTVTALIMPVFGWVNFHIAGIVFRESGTGKLFSLALYNGTGAVTGNDISVGTYFASSKWTDANTFSAHYLLKAITLPQMALWFKVQDNGTNRISSYSTDGQNFMTFHSVGRTDFLTADEIGFGFLSSDSNNCDGGLLLLSWKES